MTTPPGSIGELACDVLDQNMARFLEHAAGARAGNSPRDVHQMRVATRRLRAALRLFKDVLPAFDASKLNDELKWVASQLGQVRDLDVHLQRLDKAAANLQLSTELAPFGDYLSEQRRDAQQCLTATLSSARFMDLVQSFGAVRDWTVTPAAVRPVQHEAPERLQRVFNPFAKRAKRLRPASPSSEFHTARIRAKRLRYAAEFFEPVFGKPAQTFIKRLTAVQDVLGELQDTVVAADRMRDAAQARGTTWPVETNVAIGQVIQDDAQRRAVLKQQFVDDYDDVVDRAWRRLESNMAMS